MDASCRNLEGADLLDSSRRPLYISLDIYLIYGEVRLTFSVYQYGICVLKNSFKPLSLPWFNEEVIKSRGSLVMCIIVGLLKISLRNSVNPIK